MPIANTVISTTFDRVFATTHPYVMPKVWDNITDDIPAIHYLADNGRVKLIDGGAALDFVIAKALPTAVGYAPGAATLIPVAPDPVTRGRYEWKNLGVPVKLSGPEVAKNQGPAGIKNLVMIVVEVTRLGMLNALGGAAFGIWSTAAETQLGVVTGLVNLVATNTAENTAGSTGNISRATNTDWRNTIGTTAITDFSANGYERMRQPLFAAQRGNETTDVILMDRTSFGNFVDRATATLRFNLPLEARVASSGLIDIGVPGLNFHGALVIKDANNPLGEVRGLNTKYLMLYVNRSRNLTFSPWVSMLPANEDAIATAALWQGNLVCTDLEQQWGTEGANND